MKNGKEPSVALSHCVHNLNLPLKDNNRNLENRQISCGEEWFGLRELRRVQVYGGLDVASLLALLMVLEVGTAHPWISRLCRFAQDATSPH
jgi:hypothetical protein